ncbi:RNA polymerase sigma factor [Pelagibius sp.]|uniref:RNA polymerase sigma factor n=1 Tax=Pelagibius sp. TaxID=1931238 RepID=UPI003B5115DB
MTQPAPDDEPKPTSSDDLFTVARKAAEDRQPDRMIEALAASGFLDGLVRRLDAKWGQLPRMDIEDTVAKAVDGAYDALTQGRAIRSLGAWLWKAADNQANDRWRDDHSLRAAGDGDIDGIPGETPSTDAERLDREELAEHRRAEAIRLARRLLPRIGQGQVVSVMELVIDAVEHGVPDLSPADIGDALGISSDAARTLLGRGFSRLRREARREGITFPDDLPGAEHADDSPTMTTE